MERGLIIIRTSLITLSLAATFAFLLTAGDGITALLLATAGTLTQAAALLYMPGIMNQAWNDGRLPLAATGFAVLVAVTLVSVAGSAALLSDMVGQNAANAERRASITQLMAAKQESANRLISLDRITLAQPLLDDVSKLQAELNEFPRAGGFYQVAVRLGGPMAEALITGVIVTISLLVDVVVLLLGVSPESNRVVIESRKQSDNDVTDQTTIQHQMSFDKTDQDFDIAVEHTDGWPPEVRIVIKAYQQGALEKITVRDVQQFLRCAQAKAQSVTRICKTEINKAVLVS